MTTELIIYGAGGLGREILHMTRMLNQYSVKAFCDDHIEEGSLIDNVEVIGGMRKLEEHCRRLNNVSVILAIGDPAAKKHIQRSIASFPGVRFPALISPQATILDKSTVKIGEGSIVTAGCILTTRIEIGNYVLLNLNCTVGHDSNIGNYTSVMPGCNLAGDVSVHEEALIGMGANILNQLTIGKGAVIGAGAVVVKDVPEQVTVMGVPAKIVKSNV